VDEEPARPPKRRARRQRERQAEREQDEPFESPTVKDLRDLPIAEEEPAPAPAAGVTNGFSEHEITDESLSEFWQEFKERR
jgi:hypothetical protein